MSPETINGIIQGGALVVLALVLWGISRKVDSLLLLAQLLVNRLIDLIAISTNDNATRTQEQIDDHETASKPK